MKLSYDTARCRGKQVPFGASYDHSECRTCARSQQTEHGERQPWIGEIKFDSVCPSKTKETE